MNVRKIKIIIVFSTKNILHSFIFNCCFFLKKNICCNLSFHLIFTISGVEMKNNKNIKIYNYFIRIKKFFILIDFLRRNLILIFLKFIILVFLFFNRYILFFILKKNYDFSSIIF